MRPGADRPFVQPPSDAHVQSATSSLSSRPLLLAALAYALGQSANFLFQLRLLDQLGPLQYGETGLAHLLLVTLIFLADLGYSTLFLRETGGSASWRDLWRCALGHRLLATLALLVSTLFAWQLWGSAGASHEYLMWAAPACVFALFNYSSPMIAEGRRLAGLLVAQVAWPTALIVWLLLPLSLPLPVAARAGLAFTLGYLLQALVSVACSRQLHIWLPLVGKGQIGAALRLSLIGVCGTLHERLTPFLLAPLAPAFLPLLLILNHLLSGLSGVQAQLARLFMPAADTVPGRHRIIDAASLLLWGSALALLAITLSQGLRLFVEQRVWLQPAAILVLAWGISASSGFLATLLISARREGSLLKLLMTGMTGSSLLQAGAAWIGSADAVLWARLIGVAFMVAWLLKLLKLRPGAWGWTALGLSLLVCTAGALSWGMLFAGVLLIPTVIALLRRAPCYVPLRYVGPSQ